MWIYSLSQFSHGSSSSFTNRRVPSDSNAKIHKFPNFFNFSLACAQRLVQIPRFSFDTILQFHTFSISINIDQAVYPCLSPTDPHRLRIAGC